MCRLQCAGSKFSGASTTSRVSANAARTFGSNARPSAVGSRRRPTCTSNGSLKCSRKRPSAELAADCPRHRRSAARLTLHSLSKASSATNRLRSRRRYRMSVPLMGVGQVFARNGGHGPHPNHDLNQWLTDVPIACIAGRYRQQRYQAPARRDSGWGLPGPWLSGAAVD